MKCGAIWSGKCRSQEGSPGQEHDQRETQNRLPMPTEASPGLTTPLSPRSAQHDAQSVRMRGSITAYERSARRLAPSTRTPNRKLAAMTTG